MTELKELHFEVIDSNKQKNYNKKLKIIKVVKELLALCTKDEAIEIINQQNYK